MNLVLGRLLDALEQSIRGWSAANPGVIHYQAPGDRCVVRLPRAGIELRPLLALYLLRPPSEDDPWDHWTPELVVDLASETRERDWLAAGVRELWTIEPGTHTLRFLRRRGDTLAHHETTATYSTPLLPGFVLDLARLVPQEVRPPPKITVGERRSNRICPVCRDDVAPPLSWCEACGAALHDDCARFVGRCPSLGCEGRFTQQQTGPRLALVLRPGTTSDEAVAALANHLAIDVYDAAQRARSRVPTILGFFEEPLCQRLVADLAAAGVRAFPLEPEEIHGRPSFVVRRIERVDGGLSLFSREGREEKLLLAVPHLSVIGRYVDLTEAEEDRSSANDRGVAFPPRTRHSASPKFVHVYEGDRRLDFDESALESYRFLGDAMGPSSATNFAALATLLSTSSVDTALERAQGKLQLTRESRNARHQRERTQTNRGWMNATSWLIYLSHMRAEQGS